MIVKKPIGAIKVGGLVSRLTVGKPVPKIIIDFWKKTKQLEELKKIGAIGEADEKEEKSKKVKEEKNESIFSSKD